MKLINCIATLGATIIPAMWVLKRVCDKVEGKGQEK